MNVLVAVGISIAIGLTVTVIFFVWLGRAMAKLERSFNARGDEKK